MHVRFDCPECLRPEEVTIAKSASLVGCRVCGWTRDVEAVDCGDGILSRCLVCGCPDLWRDLRSGWKSWLVGGVAAAVVGAIAALLGVSGWWIAIGVMPVLLVVPMALRQPVVTCYQCRARYRGVGRPRGLTGYRSETAKRYRLGLAPSRGAGAQKEGTASR